MTAMERTMRYAFFCLLMLLGTAAGADGLHPGERLYGLHCATCHGASASIPGPMADTLKRRPSDLTTLRRRNGGRFPVAETVRQIDGRARLAGHGAEMPVYGWFFEGPPARLRTPSGGTVATTQDIADIVRWLQTIQRD